MKRFHNITVLLFLLSVMGALSMNSTDFGKFLFMLSGKFSNTLEEEARNRTGVSRGYLYFRPIKDVPFLRPTAEDRYFYYHNLAPDQVVITKDVRRIIYKDSKAVMYFRNMDIIPPPEEEPEFNKFFLTLTEGVWRVDSYCTFTFDVTSPGGNEFIGYSRNHCNYTTIKLTCNEMVVTVGYEPYPYSKVKSTLLQRFPTPKSWNAKPC